MNDPNGFNTSNPQRHPMGVGGPMMSPGGQMGQPMPQQNFQGRGFGGGGPPPGQFNTNANMGHPNMMGSGMGGPPPQQEPPKPQKLKAELTNKERGYYSNMLSKLELGRAGESDKMGNRVDGKQAVTFFKTSGVNIDVLKQIYKICARSHVESLSRDEFYMALRLIAYAQNGIPVTEDSIAQNIDAPLPQFKTGGEGMGGMGGMGGPPQPPAPTIADSLPDLNNINVAALNQNPEGSLIPGMDQRLKEREVQKAQEKMEKNQDSPWFLRPEDVQKYNTFFDHFNKRGGSALSMDETMGAFKQTQLDDKTLESVWGLVDTEEVGEFDRKMFCMSMHLLYKIKVGSKLPTTLPHVLKACVTSYFSDGTSTSGGLGGMGGMNTNNSMSTNNTMNSGPPGGPPGGSLGGPPGGPPPNRPNNMGPGNPNNLGNQGMPQRPPENSKKEEDPFANSLGGNLLGSDNGPSNGSSNMGLGGMGRDSNVSKGSSNSMGMGGGMPQPSPGMGNNSMSQNNPAQAMMENTIKEQEKMIQSRREDISGMNSQFSANNQLLTTLKEKSEKLRKELDKLNNEYKNIQGKVKQQNEEIKREINNIGNMTDQLSTAVGNMNNQGPSQNFTSPQATPKKEIDLRNFGGVKASHENMGGMGGPGGPGGPGGNPMNNTMNQRQPRMMGGPPNGGGGQMPNGMGQRNRPQSIDPNRIHNIQPQNFGNMNGQPQRQNDNNFYGGGGMNGQGPPNGGPDNNAENIDWGL